MSPPKAPFSIADRKALLPANFMIQMGDRQTGLAIPLSQDPDHAALIGRVKNLMTKASAIIQETFGKLTTMKIGNKLATATSGEVGSEDFSVTVHVDTTPYGVKRLAWNSFAAGTGYVTSFVTKGGLQLSVAEVSKNTEDLSKTVRHLAAIFDEIEGKMKKKMAKMPGLERVPEEIATAEQIIIDSQTGMANLLTTYVLNRMPEKIPDANVAIKVAQVIAKVLINLEDADFATFTNFQTNQASRNNENEKAAMSEMLVRNTPEDAPGLISEDLMTNLARYLPVNAQHLKQLREIGKMIGSVEKLQKKEGTIAQLFTQLEGVCHPDGTVRFDDDSYWDPRDNLFHYNDSSSETRFNSKQLQSLNSVSYRFKKN